MKLSQRRCKPYRLFPPGSRSQPLLLEVSTKGQHNATTTARSTGQPTEEAPKPAPHTARARPGRLASREELSGAGPATGRRGGREPRAETQAAERGTRHPPPRLTCFARAQTRSAAGRARPLHAGRGSGSTEGRQFPLGSRRPAADCGPGHGKGRRRRRRAEVGPPERPP